MNKRLSHFQAILLATGAILLIAWPSAFLCCEIVKNIRYLRQWPIAPEYVETNHPVLRTIEFTEGTFEFSEPILLEGNTALCGAGSGRTTLVYTGKGDFVRVTGAGNIIRDLTLKADDSQEYGFTVRMISASDSVIEDCELAWARGGHIWVETSRNILIRNNDVHYAYNYLPPHGYGIALLDETRSCLVEGNRIDHVRHSMIVKMRAHDNIFRENVSTNPMPDADQCDVCVHGWLAYRNLWTKNTFSFAQCSDQFGAAGPWNTFDDNIITGRGVYVTLGSDRTIVTNNHMTSGGAVYVSDDSDKCIVKGNTHVFKDFGRMWSVGEK